MENINGKVKTVAKKSIVEIKKAKLDGKPDSSINIRFLSTYFRGEVDILAVLCYNRYPRKATKYEQLNDNGRGSDLYQAETHFLFHIRFYKR